MRPGLGIWGQRMGSAAIPHAAFLAVNENWGDKMLRLSLPL